MKKIWFKSDSLVFTYNTIDEIDPKNNNIYTRRCVLLRAAEGASEEDMINEFNEYLDREERDVIDFPCLLDCKIMHTIIFEDDMIYVELSLEGLKNIIKNGIMEYGRRSISIESIASDMIRNRDDLKENKEK